MIDDPANDGSDPGAYATAMLYPPYAGALGPEGEFRRGVGPGTEDSNHHGSAE